MLAAGKLPVRIGFPRGQWITYRGRTLVERQSFFITPDAILHVIVDDEVQLG